MDLLKSSSKFSKKQIILLSIPVFFSNIAIPFVGIVDTGLMGNLGETKYLAATSISTSVMTMIIWSFGFLRMGTVGIVAQAYGRSDYREIINKLPSKLINIRVQDKESTLSSKYNQDLIKKINNSIGREGRILVRASGTEDLIRVLVEHSDVKQLNYFLDYFCDNIKKH